MTGRILVSVLIPVRNGARTIDRAIRSALTQADDQVAIEVVVVDDGSTDETAAIAESVGDDRVTVVKQPAEGVTVARNRAAAVADGIWLVPLDGDDILLPGAVARLLSQADDDVDVVCGAMTRVTADGDVTDQTPEQLGPEYHGVVALFRAGTMLIRRVAWEAVGGQLPGLTFGENGELGMRLAARAQQIGHRIAAITTPTVRYSEREVVRHDDVQRAEAARMIAEIDRDLLARSRPALASYWSISAVHWARAGNIRAALSAQLAACRARPADLRQLGRLVVICIAPLRRRRYPPRELGAPGH